MGLAERRAIKAFQDEQYPELKKAIDKIVGFDVKIDVQWDSLAEENMAHLYAEAFPKVYFSPLIEALRAIAADKMGKDALKASLKSIVICNVAHNYSANYAIAFENGVLKIDHEPVTNVDDVEERRSAIVALLEKSL